MCTLTPSHRSPQFWWARLKPRQASSLQSGQPGSPPVFLWEAVLSSACFSGSAKPKRWSLPLLLSQAQNQHPVFPMWSVFVYLQKNTLKGLSYVWGGSYKALWRESKRTSWVGPRVKSAVTLAMTVSVWVPVCVPRPEAASEGNPNHLSSRSSNTGSSAWCSLKLPQMGRSGNNSFRILNIKLPCVHFILSPLFSWVPYYHICPMTVVPTQRLQERFASSGLLIANINSPLENSCLTRIWNT